MYIPYKTRAKIKACKFCLFAWIDKPSSYIFPPALAAKQAKENNNTGRWGMYVISVGAEVAQVVFAT